MVYLRSKIFQIETTKKFPQVGSKINIEVSYRKVYVNRMLKIFLIFVSFLPLKITFR